MYIYLFGSAQGLFDRLLEVRNLHVRGADLLRVLCLHLRQLTTKRTRKTG